MTRVRIYNGKENQEERLREFNGQQRPESDIITERKATYFQEGSVQYAEYCIQYHAPPANNR